MFYQPVRIFMGRGVVLQDLMACCENLRAEAGLSKPLNILLLTSPGAQDRAWPEQIKRSLSRQSNLQCWSLDPQPTLALLDSFLEAFSEGQSHPDLIIACGGGSVMDAAKALGLGLLQKDFSFRDYFNAVKDKPSSTLTQVSIPIICIPTTAGSGAEVTPFATLWSETPARKYSLHVPFPYAALIDPDFSSNLPRVLRLSTGLDALVQAFESIWNLNANTLSSTWALQALKLAWKALPELYQQEQQAALQEDLSEAALLSGLAISQTRTSLCHSISYPLTAHLGVPHGLACAFSLRAVWDFNLEADDGRLQAVAQLLGATPAEFSLRLQQFLDSVALQEHLNPYFYPASQDERCQSQLRLQTILLELNSPERVANNLRFTSSSDLQTIFRASSKTFGFV